MSKMPKLIKGGNDPSPINSSTLVLFFLLTVLFVVFSIFTFVNPNIEIITIGYLYALHIIYTVFLFYVTFTNTDLIKEISIGSLNEDKNAFLFGLGGESYSINILLIFASVVGMLVGIISLTMIIVVISYMVDYYGKDTPLKNLSNEHAEKLKNYKIFYVVTTGLSLVLSLMFVACYLDDFTIFLRNLSGIILALAVILFSVIQLIWARELLTIKLDHLVS